MSASGAEQNSEKATMAVETPSAQLYLDLMKKALTYTLWPETGTPIELLKSRRSSRTRRLARGLARLLRYADLQLVKLPTASQEERESGRIWPIHADTMIGIKRLDNIQFCAVSAIRDGIPGDFIETGVWRGGACIFMRAVLAACGVKDRRVFVADSFAGLPKPDAGKYPADAGDKLHEAPVLAVSLEEVQNNFRRYGLLDEQVVFLNGWFKDTLPRAGIEKLALMRLDGDMYQSTMEALVALYPKLSVGGHCIIDDYALPACRQAVDDFRSQNGIGSPIQKVDWSGVYWRRER
jgi:hypothetical protein